MDDATIVGVMGANRSQNSDADAVKTSRAFQGPESLEPVRSYLIASAITRQARSKKRGVGEEPIGVGHGACARGSRSALQSFLPLGQRH
ncbi:MAG: hypothetical protein H0X67_24360 [Acidobacteria bacterium]|nr:hypothetical protein [Acidobacteriota bacterium]